MRRGDVYWVRLDPTEGSEQAGTRPAVIVSRDSVNRASSVVVVCPLTSASNVTRLYPSDVLVQTPDGGLAVDSVILTLQIRAVAKTRLGHRLGALKPTTLQRLNHALDATLDLD
jgi:mRNA interferase MazF